MRYTEEQVKYMFDREDLEDKDWSDWAEESGWSAEELYEFYSELVDFQTDMSNFY